MADEFDLERSFELHGTPEATASAKRKFALLDWLCTWVVTRNPGDLPEIVAGSPDRDFTAAALASVERQWAERHPLIDLGGRPIGDEDGP